MILVAVVPQAYTRPNHNAAWMRDSELLNEKFLINLNMNLQYEYSALIHPYYITNT
jgi:hypothetical protein